MILVFKYTDDIVIADYLQKGQTITDTYWYYASLLMYLRKIIKLKCCGNCIKMCCSTRTMPFVKESVNVMAAISDCGFKLIGAPNLASSDDQTFIYPKLKTIISSTHFQCDDFIIHSVENLDVKSALMVKKRTLKVALRPIKLLAKVCRYWRGICWKLMQYNYQDSNPYKWGSLHINHSI